MDPIVLFMRGVKTKLALSAILCVIFTSILGIVGFQVLRSQHPFLYVDSTHSGWQPTIVGYLTLVMPKWIVSEAAKIAALEPVVHANCYVCSEDLQDYGDCTPTWVFFAFGGPVCEKFQCISSYNTGFHCKGTKLPYPCGSSECSDGHLTTCA